MAEAKQEAKQDEKKDNKVVISTFRKFIVNAYKHISFYLKKK